MCLLSVTSFPLSDHEDSHSLVFLYSFFSQANTLGLYRCPFNIFDVKSLNLQVSPWPLSQPYHWPLGNPESLTWDVPCRWDVAGNVLSVQVSTSGFPSTWQLGEAEAWGARLHLLGKTTGGDVTSNRRHTPFCYVSNHWCLIPTSIHSLGVAKWYSSNSITFSIISCNVFIKRCLPLSVGFLVVTDVGKARKMLDSFTLCTRASRCFLTSPKCGCLHLKNV